MSCPLQGHNEHDVEVKSVAPSGDIATKWILLYEKNKNPIKINGWKHHMKDKRQGQRMAKRHVGPSEPN